MPQPVIDSLGYFHKNKKPRFSIIPPKAASPDRIAGDKGKGNIPSSKNIGENPTRAVEMVRIADDNNLFELALLDHRLEEHSLLIGAFGRMGGGQHPPCGTPSAAECMKGLVCRRGNKPGLARAQQGQRGIQPLLAKTETDNQIRRTCGILPGKPVADIQPKGKSQAERQDEQQHSKQFMQIMPPSGRANGLKSCTQFNRDAHGRYTGFDLSQHNLACVDDGVIAYFRVGQHYRVTSEKNTLAKGRKASNIAVST
jgi:hypothetical protein